MASLFDRHPTLDWLRKWNDDPLDNGQILSLLNLHSHTPDGPLRDMLWKAFCEHTTSLFQNPEAQGVPNVFRAALVLGHHDAALHLHSLTQTRFWENHQNRAETFVSKHHIADVLRHALLICQDDTHVQNIFETARRLHVMESLLIQVLDVLTKIKPQTQAKPLLHRLAQTLRATPANGSVSLTRARNRLNRNQEDLSISHLRKKTQDEITALLAAESALLSFPKGNAKDTAALIDVLFWVMRERSATVSLARGRVNAQPRTNLPIWLGIDPVPPQIQIPPLRVGQAQFPSLDTAHSKVSLERVRQTCSQDPKTALAFIFKGKNAVPAKELAADACKKAILKILSPHLKAKSETVSA